ncbi:MAG: hypothetical protein CL760_05210 [Chloroflexi bacterium]|nr:hypothetical protein [Chloroflexota bacterium]|tara:strand:- start:14277 stop:14930 length:654 start_codon:yes stop_codon:yes gene_type:complete
MTVIQAETKQDIQAKLKNVILGTQGRGITTIINGVIHNLEFRRFDGSYKEFLALKKPNRKLQSDNSLSDMVAEIYDAKKNEDIIDSTHNTLKAFGLELEFSHSNIDDVLAILSDYIKDSIHSHLVNGESDFNKDVIHNLIGDYRFEEKPESTFKTITEVIADKKLNKTSVSQYFKDLSKTLSWCKDSDRQFLIFSHTDFEMLVSKGNIDNLSKYYSI